MKYVMFKTRHSADVTQFVPVLFPDHLVHADVARAMRAVMRDRSAKPVSAGEYALHLGTAHGRSESLGLEAHTEDGDIILSYGYRHGLNFDERE